MKLFYFLLLLSFTLVYCEIDYPWMYLKPYGSDEVLKPLKPDSYVGDYDSYIQLFNPIGIYIG
jgi:hypothetical protein